MEKKTIGKFISALRRANGMTQKELGEKLFVSDKTVSRWECDECTPELSLIPVIAEIFGITTDELLRGERNAQSGETTQNQKAKSDKQFRLMLHSRMVRFRNLSMISVGISLAAVILALVIDLSFTKGILAFGVGAVLILAAVICQLCFASSAMLRRDEEDDSHGEDIQKANSRVTAVTAGVLMAIAAMLAFILPMGIFGGSYYGLSAEGILLYGAALAGAVLIVIYLIYMFWIRKTLVKKGLIWEDDRAGERSGAYRALLKRMTAIACVIALVLAGCAMTLSALGTKIFASSISFDNYDDFKTGMENRALALWKNQWAYGVEVDISAGGGIINIDTDGDGVYDEVQYAPEFSTDTITDEAGNVLCEYITADIAMMEHSVDKETGAVCITVYTQEEMRNAADTYDTVMMLIVVLVAVDFAVCAIVYMVRRRKL